MYKYISSIFNKYIEINNFEKLYLTDYFFNLLSDSDNVSYLTNSEKINFLKSELNYVLYICQTSLSNDIQDKIIMDLLYNKN